MTQWNNGGAPGWGAPQNQGQQAPTAGFAQPQGHGFGQPAPAGGFGQPPQGGQAPGWGAPQNQGQQAPAAGFGQPQGGAWGPPSTGPGSEQGGQTPGGGFGIPYDPFAKFDEADPSAARGRYFAAPEVCVVRVDEIRWRRKQDTGQEMVIVGTTVLASLNGHHSVGEEVAQIIKRNNYYSDRDLKAVLAALLGFNPSRDAALVKQCVSKYTAALSMHPNGDGPGIFTGFHARVETYVKQSAKTGKAFTIHSWLPVPQLPEYTPQHYEAILRKQYPMPVPRVEDVASLVERAAAEYNRKLQAGEIRPGQRPGGAPSAAQDEIPF